jgi:hypothetical protein
MMTPYTLHLTIFLLVCAVAYWFYIDGMRIKAKFALYKVRDEFVFYVAAGKLNEDGRFFQFFYTSINTMLREAPNVGIDDILEIIPQESIHIRKARKDSLKAILSDPAMEDAEIKKTVSCFFNAFMLMILSHSSLTRFFYIVALRIVAPIMKRINSALNQHVAAAAIATVSALVIVPGIARRGLDAINYVEKIQHQDAFNKC